MLSDQGRGRMVMVGTDAASDAMLLKGDAQIEGYGLKRG